MEPIQFHTQLKVLANHEDWANSSKDVQSVIETIIPKIFEDKSGTPNDPKRIEQGVVKWIQDNKELIEEEDVAPIGIIRSRLGETGEPLASLIEPFKGQAGLIDDAAVEQVIASFLAPQDLISLKQVSVEENRRGKENFKHALREWKPKLLNLTKETVLPADTPKSKSLLSNEAIIKGTQKNIQTEEQLDELINEMQSDLDQLSSNDIPFVQLAICSIIKNEEFKADAVKGVLLNPEPIDHLTLLEYAMELDDEVIAEQLLNSFLSEEFISPNQAIKFIEIAAKYFTPQVEDTSQINSAIKKDVETFIQKSLQNLKDTGQKIQLHTSLASIMIKNGNVEQAKLSLAFLIELLQKITDRGAQSQALQPILRLLCQLGMNEHAEDLFLKTASPPTFTQKVSDFFERYFFNSDPQSFIQSNLATCEATIASELVKQGKPEEAESQFQAAIDRAKAIEDKVFIRIAFNEIIDEMLSCGLYERAEEILKQEGFDNDPSIELAKQKIALSALDHGDIDQVVEIAKSMKNPMKKAEVYAQAARRISTHLQKMA